MSRNLNPQTIQKYPHRPGRNCSCCRVFARTGPRGWPAWPVPGTAARHDPMAWCLKFVLLPGGPAGPEGFLVFPDFLSNYGRGAPEIADAWIIDAAGIDPAAQPVRRRRSPSRWEQQQPDDTDGKHDDPHDVQVQAGPQTGVHGKQQDRARADQEEAEAGTHDAAPPGNRRCSTLPPGQQPHGCTQLGRRPRLLAGEPGARPATTGAMMAITDSSVEGKAHVRVVGLI
jgi:hypothetical protein